MDEYSFSLLRRPEFNMNMEIRVKMRHKTGPKASQVNMDRTEDGPGGAIQYALSARLNSIFEAKAP